MTSTAASRPWLGFARHYVEMIVAMFVGMGVLALLFSAVGIDPTYDSAPEAAHLLMSFNMSVGMVLIMRYRRHSWPVTLEMCAAMFAPAIPLFPLLWMGAISGDGLMMFEHLAMLPLMLALMLYRRSEYLHQH